MFRNCLCVAVALTMLAAPKGVDADGQREAPFVHLRIEYVDASHSLDYYVASGQVIDSLAAADSASVSQHLVTTGDGLGFLYVRELSAALPRPAAEGFWTSISHGSQDRARAGALDGQVKKARDLVLAYREDLSYRPGKSRRSYDDRDSFFFFIYGVPRDKRSAFERMSTDYRELVTETHVLSHFDVFEIVEDGEQLRFLIVRGSEGNADFWRSEIELDAKISGERFDAIGLAAEAMMSSVETMAAVRVSQGRAPSPLLRDRAEGSAAPPIR